MPTKTKPRPTSAPKFPRLIHVTHQVPPNDAPFLAVEDQGVFGVDETTDAAIYQLVSVGRVQVERRFVQTRRARR